jgi:glycerate-2-kinase
MPDRIAHDARATNAPGDLLRSLFDAALSAVDPGTCFRGRLPQPPKGRTIVIGAGKAAASMAAAFERAWPHRCEGLVVTRDDHGLPTRFIEVVEAAHPVPDERGEAAARRILDIAHSAGPDDLVVALISGGASALLALPRDGLSLDDKRQVNRALLRSGAAIEEMNLVRRCLSAVKGGALAAAASPARLVTYVISDIPGDDPAAVGSGPTIPQPVDPAGALAILGRRGITVPEAVEDALRRLSALVAPAASGEVHIVATAWKALEAAAEAARALGIAPLILGDAIQGEARDAGEVIAGIARSVAARGVPIARPCVLLSGGETTVTVRGSGRGGRNTEFLLSLAIALRGERAVSALACDTDGIDGSEDDAGAWFDDRFIAEAGHAGIDLPARLAANDSHAPFRMLGRLVTTGPTRTNVNDFRAVLIQ